MPWDGNGTFDRVHNFSADASAGIQAQAARFDAEFDGFKTGLENCVTVDGQTTVTGDADMGGFKHTAVAAATSTDNYLRADQNANQVGIFVRDVNTGVTGKISASAAVFPTAFTDGQRVTVKVSADGSADANRWIVINNLSANIVDNKGSAVPASWMVQDGNYDLVYDASASAFVLLNSEIQAGAVVIADASSKFTATDVEAALAELADGGVSVTKIKEATTSRAVNVTYTDDDELAGWSVAAASWYSIDGFLQVYQNGGDFKFRFTVTAANQVEKQHWDVEDESGTQASAYETDITGGTSITTMTDTEQYGFRIKGTFQTHATTPSTLDFQWAQSSSDASATNLLAGSWLEIAKLA